MQKNNYNQETSFNCTEPVHGVCLCKMYFFFFSNPVKFVEPEMKSKRQNRLWFGFYYSFVDRRMVGKTNTTLWIFRNLWEVNFSQRSLNQQTSLRKFKFKLIRAYGRARAENTAVFVCVWVCHFSHAFICSVAVKFILHKQSAHCPPYKLFPHLHILWF